MRSDRKKTLIYAILLAMVPWITGGICRLFFGPLSLPASGLNDELFYYGQVASMLKYGVPAGYFGFNVQLPLKLSFGCWSPVLFVPWIVYGAIFGWNLASPIIANILILSVSLFLFAIITKPNALRLGAIAAFTILYTPTVRYMLSGMSETILLSLLILFIALSLKLCERVSVSSFVMLLLLGAVLVTMRPYFVLLFLLPFVTILFSRVKEKRILRLIITAVSAIIALGGYAILKHFLSAPYLTPYYETGWIRAFLHDGLSAGFSLVGSKVGNWAVSVFYESRAEFLGIERSFGLSWVLYMLTGPLLLALGIIKLIRALRAGNDSDRDLLESLNAISYSIVMLGLFAAMVLMYKTEPGARHLILFVAGAVYLMLSIWKKKDVLIPIAFILCVAFGLKFMCTADFKVPAGERELLSRIEECRTVLEKEMVIDETSITSFENTVIWLWDDETENGTAETDWRMLYALPTGFGVNLCLRDFVLLNFDDLEPRYIALVPGGGVEQRCKDSGFTLLYTGERFAIYRR